MPANGQWTQAAAAGSHPIAGQLLDSDGKPLAGVKMCLWCRPQSIWFPHLPAKGNTDCDFATTDRSGYFSFAPQENDGNLLAFTDQGYVVAKTKHFTYPLKVRLTRWAKLQGVLKSENSQFPAGITVQARYRNDDMEDQLGPYPYFTAKTDEHGRFDFGRVLAGDYSVSRQLDTSTYGAAVSVTAPEDMMTQCVVPVIGRDVRGQIILPKGIEQHWHADAQIVQRIELPHVALPANVLKMTEQQQIAWYNQWEEQTADGKSHAARRRLPKEEGIVQIEPDGSFVAADLCEGSHAIRVLFLPLLNNEIDYEHHLISAGYDFNVASVNDGTMTPLKLGALSPRTAEITNANQPAPDIAFRGRDGSVLLLSQFRGKVVLLDFWGTWCAVCKHDLPNVKAVFDAFGSNPRFAMISLSVDDKRTDWEQFIQQKQMAWTQGLLGSRDEAWQAKMFCVPGYPSYWIIGPDGKVLADGFQINALRPILEKALKGMN